MAQMVDIYGRIADVRSLREVEVNRGGNKVKSFVCNFSVVDSPSAQLDGEWINGEANFYECTAWGRLGEHIASLKKGEPVAFKAQRTAEAFERKNGDKDAQWKYTIASGGVDLNYAGVESDYETDKQTTHQQNGGSPVSKTRSSNATSRSAVKKTATKRETAPVVSEDDDDMPF